MTKKQDRKAGLTQLGLFDDTPEKPLPEPSWRPPTLPERPAEVKTAPYLWQEFGWHFCSYIIYTGSGHKGWLYEWIPSAQEWRLVTTTEHYAHGQTYKALSRLARQMLVKGQRPEAEAANGFLANLAGFYRKHGTHRLARDNGPETI